MRNWAKKYCFNKEIFFNDLIRILKVWSNPSDENKDEYVYLQKLFEKWEEGKFDVSFLSKVLKYPEDILLYYIIDNRFLYNRNDRTNEDYKNERNTIRELYFQINPLKRGPNLKNNINTVNSIIEKCPSYILSRYLICDKLDCNYTTFSSILSSLEKFKQKKQYEKVKMIEDLDNKIKEKQSKSKQDLQNDLLELLKAAPKEAFESKEDLFYYLLIKNFYYFKMLFDSESGNSIDDSFIQKCNEIYKKKFPESDQNSNFFNKLLFYFLLGKFVELYSYHYRERLEILEEKEKNYFASKNNESVENESIKDNFNNNKFTMKPNADSVVTPHPCDNHYRKRKSIDCNDKSSFKKQRLEGVIKRIHENKSHPLGNSKTNFDNQEIVDETKLDNYLKYLFRINPNVDVSKLGDIAVKNLNLIKKSIREKHPLINTFLITLEKLRSKNINDNRLNQDESFNLNLLNQETPASQNLQFSNLENEISNDNKVQYRGF